MARAKRIRRLKLQPLPQWTRRQAAAVNALLNHLPQTPFEMGFREKVRGMLGPLLHADVDVWVDSTVAVDAGSFGRVVASPTCLTIIGLPPRMEKVVLEVDLSVAQAAIDKLLGGDGSDVDAHRPLSEIEQGVFSFLLLKLIALAQEGYASEQQVSLRLEGMYADPVALKDKVDLAQGFVCVSLRVFFDLRVAAARLFIPLALIESTALATPPPQGPTLERVLRRLRDRAELVRDVSAPLVVEIGRIQIPAGDVANLEVDDIVLVEGAELRLEGAGEGQPAALTGQVRCRIGGGGHGTLIGAIGVGSTGRYEVTVDSIAPTGEPSQRSHLVKLPPDGEAKGDEGMVQEHTTEAPPPIDRNPSVLLAALGRKRLAGMAARGRAFSSVPVASVVEVDDTCEHAMGVEDEGDAPAQDEVPSPEAGNLLEDVSVALVVELGRVSVSAADVLGLRAGQIIELARAPGEPVDLVVDGKRVGKGELVEIDGDLGVRILSLSK